MADHQRLTSLFTQDTQIQLHPDNEHKKDQTDLAEDIERFEGGIGKQKTECFRKKMA